MGSIFSNLIKVIIAPYTFFQEWFKKGGNTGGTALSLFALFGVAIGLLAWLGAVFGPNAPGGLGFLGALATFGIGLLAGFLFMLISWGYHGLLLWWGAGAKARPFALLAWHTAPFILSGGIAILLYIIALFGATSVFSVGLGILAVVSLVLALGIVYGGLRAGPAPAGKAFGRWIGFELLLIVIIGLLAWLGLSLMPSPL